MTNATKAKSRAKARPSKHSRREVERRRRQRRNLGFGLAAAALLAVVVVSVLSGGSNTQTAPPSQPGSVSITGGSGSQLAAGTSVPDFSAPALGGGTFQWSSYLGKPTVLAIWAPWCPHCQVELPKLDAAVKARPGLQMVSVATSIDSHPGPSVPGYMSDHGLSFPVAIDDAKLTLYTGLGVQGFPTVYYVDSTGKVVQMTEGEVPDAQLGSILDGLAST